MTINFISSRDSDEIRTMHTKSDNTEIIMDDETDEIIKEVFGPLLQIYQVGLEERMRGSEFVFDSADLLLYELHRISLNRGGSYIDYPKWLKNKKATTNPKKKKNDNKCFKYDVTSALNQQNKKKIHKEYLTLSLLWIYIIGKK